MTLQALKASRALWRRRELYRKAKHTAALQSNNHDAVTKWGRLLNEARQNVTRRDKQIAARGGPRIITSAQMGLRFQNVFGSKGTVVRGAWHYTAGHRSKDAAALAREMRADHAFHISKGWGGGSYEAMIADDGTIGFLNPMFRKSAGVAGHNTGLVNICCPGTTGDRLTTEQKHSVAWLRDNWHTTRVPRAYRLPRPARELSFRGHKEYPGNPTACPGAMLADYKETWR